MVDVAARTGQGSSLSYLRALLQACRVPTSLLRRFFREIPGSRIAETLEYLHDVRADVSVEAAQAAARRRPEIPRQGRARDCVTSRSRTQCAGRMKSN
jgi:hypothetical protein